jgi:diaminopimelate decarboxylase
MSERPQTEGPDEPPEDVVLIDEEGAERRFKLHDAFDADGQVYYLVEAVEDPEQVLLLKETGGGLETVDPEELDRVLALLEAEE